MEGCTVEKAISESMKLMGMTSLKAKQHEAITSFLSGNDVFVSLPTGYGKSAIYLLMPPIFDRVKGMQPRS